MKIINLGIFAHVDAGKTTLTEYMLYASGAIRTLGSVDKGTTQTDGMPLEQKRGITISATTTSLEWNATKLNLLDTPGHMDFIAEVERSLAVLDGAVLVVSAVKGIQTQTRVILQALKSMRIPTLIFINKIDQEGVLLQELQADLGTLLEGKALYLQTFTESPQSVVTKQVTDSSVFATLLNTDSQLAEQYVNEAAITPAECTRALQRAVQAGTLYPVYYGAAKTGVGVPALLDAITSYLPQAKAATALSAVVYKIDYDAQLQKRVYLRVFGGSLSNRESVPVVGKEAAVKISNLQRITQGKREPVSTVPAGDIAIIPYDNTLMIGDILGEASEQIPRGSLTAPTLRASIAPADTSKRKELLVALTNLSDEDPYLRYSFQPTTQEIAVSLFGEVQKEVIASLLQERYQLETVFGELQIIYKERPATSGEHTIHIWVMPNTYEASIGLTIEPLPQGSGMVYESKISYGYITAPFQRAVEQGVRLACQNTPEGWELTDCKIVFSYAYFSSVTSTPADFRSLAPIVLHELLAKIGTELLEPYYQYELTVPEAVTGKALHDLAVRQGRVDTVTPVEGNVVIAGIVPVITTQSYQQEVTAYTNGRGTFSVVLHGYLPGGLS